MMPSLIAPRLLLRPLLLLVALTALALPASGPRAQLRVEVVGVGANQLPIAVATFARDGQTPPEFEAIIRANLQRSGLFRLVEAGTAPLAENAAVSHAEWKGRGADALVVGSIARLADGRLDIRYRLYDTVKQTQLDALTVLPRPEQLRRAAHQIADRIFEKLTGERGVFDTRIAYVVTRGRNAHELQIADADGANPQTVLASSEPIISP